jgi:hypothetical protein
MWFRPTGYLAATRHPWACVLFVLPLLLFYEVGLYLLGPTPPEDLRNGADAWLRGILQHVGISPIYGAPVLLLGVLFVWNLWRRDDRPGACLGVCLGMAVESAAFALCLLCLSQLLFPLLQMVGNLLETPAARLVGLVSGAAANTPEFAWEQVVGYVGAGIYEETVFRLLFFSGLVALFLLMDMPRTLTLVLAGVASALMFAGAHNLGAHGEPFQLVIFLFRTCAGLYFTWIYHVRGFGIAVGAHASYDVLVGFLMRSV